MELSNHLSMDTVAAASRPWTFTQNHPLDTDNFVRAAEARRIELPHDTLRELYRVGLLIPFIEVRSRKVPGSTPASHKSDAEPSAMGSVLLELRHARERGRLLDPALHPFRSSLR